jgi:hypothetical protein
MKPILKIPLTILAYLIPILALVFLICGCAGHHMTTEQSIAVALQAAVDSNTNSTALCPGGYTTNATDAMYFGGLAHPAASAHVVFPWATFLIVSACGFIAILAVYFSTKPRSVKPDPSVWTGENLPPPAPVRPPMAIPFGEPTATARKRSNRKAKKK